MEILAKLVVSASSLGLAPGKTDTESFAKLFGFAGCGRNQSRVSAFAAKPRFGDWRLEIGGRAADRVAVVGTRGSMIDQHVEDIKILWARKRKIWKDT